MNACIRAIVRIGHFYGIRVVGIQRGYTGLIHGSSVDLDRRSVANIIQRGGTILGTSRCEDFKEKEGRRKAYHFIRKVDMEGLIVIGGEGSFKGAQKFMEEYDIPIVGIPGTIDNDLYGSDITIGFDTAVNTAVEAIDRIRDTATSHERLFFVEVMGKLTGFIALEVGLAGGAEAVVIPEIATNLDELCDILQKSRLSGKASSIVIVAEGDEVGGAFSLADSVKHRVGMESRVAVLGHIQRGGAPTAGDRILASRLGVAAVDTMLEKVSGVTVGEILGKIVRIPFEDTWKKVKKPDLSRLELTDKLAR